MSIFQISMQAGILIIAIVIIRSVALHRLPKKTFLVLWAIAIIRLLIPFSIPSKISIYSVIDKSLNWSSFKNNYSNVDVLFSLYYPSVETSLGLVEEELNILNPLICIWFIGVVISMSFLLFVYWKNYNELRFSTIIRHNVFIDKWIARSKLKRPIVILQSDRITTPITTGYLRPRIILPKTMNMEDTHLIQYILAHEYYHIQRFDTVWKLLIACTVCIHWFNPLVWIMASLINRDLEITCDEMVVRHFGSGNKREYAYSLIAMAEQRNKFMPLYNGFSKTVAEERIVSIMKTKKISVITICLSIILIAVFGTAFTTTAMSANDSISIIEEKVSEYDTRNYEEAKSEWEQFGLVYNFETEQVYYKGKLVKFFVDNRSATNDFLGTVYNIDGGEYYLLTRRDSTGKLIAIDEITENEAKEIARWWQ